MFPPKKNISFRKGSSVLKLFLFYGSFHILYYILLRGIFAGVSSHPGYSRCEDSFWWWWPCEFSFQKETEIARYSCSQYESWSWPRKCFWRYSKRVSWTRTCYLFPDWWCCIVLEDGGCRWSRFLIPMKIGILCFLKVYCWLNLQMACVAFRPWP